jgi:aconitate hydratase
MVSVFKRLFTLFRSNLIGMGIVPLQYINGESTDSLGLSGKEEFTIDVPADLKTGQEIDVRTSKGKSFKALARFDTELELAYFNNGGILNYMIRKMIA